MWVFLDDKKVKETEVSLEINSLGIQYGYGVFETMAFVNLELEYLKDHLLRLENSMNVFGLKYEIDGEDIIKKSHELMALNSLLKPVVKLTILKGLKRDHLLLTTRENTYSEDMYHEGFKLKISDVKRNPLSKMVYHKTCNYMELLSEKTKATKEGYDEVIFLNIKDEVSECSISNLFWVRDRTLYTPEIKTGILNGIMRQKVIDHANRLTIKVCEGAFMFEELDNADAVFITNSIMGIMPVSKINNTWYSKDNEILYQLRNR